MKKRIAAAVVAVAVIAVIVIVVLTNRNSNSEIKVADYNVEDYVTLGEYKGLVVEYNKPMTVTDEEVENQIQQVLASNASYETVTNRNLVKEGDYINIDYAGKMNGVAFSGGTATGKDIQVGSAGFIAGFEDQLVGAKVGTTFDINVTFPENYQNTELAGKPAVFTITVNAIKSKTTPKLNDAFVQSVSTQSKTVAEFKEEVRKSLQTSRDGEVAQYKEYYAEQQAMDNAEVKSYPSGMIESMVAKYKETIKKVAKESGKDYNTYIKETFQLEENELNEKLKEYMEKTAKINLVLEAIQKKENITMTDEEQEKAIMEYAESQGCATKEELYEKFEEVEVKRYVMQVKVLDFITASATIKEAGK